jgi:hypothetical protein
VTATTATLTAGTNVYLSLSDAETYMSRRYDPTGLWDAATDAVKNKLLLHATRIIDRQPWRGAKTDTDQSLEFPRDGYATTDDEHTPVKDACTEQALWLLIHRPDTREHMQAQGVRSATVGGVTESYGPGMPDELCPEARRLLRRWLVTCAALV